MTFRVGQRVKYVGPDFRSLAQNLWRCESPMPGGEYTVREIGCCNNGIYQEPAIHLSEIINTPREWLDGFFELWMNAKFFRPLVSRETDISALTALLNPANHKEFADG